MAIPKDRHRFVTSIAELAQRLGRHEVRVSMNEDGEAVRYRSGLSGKILDALYEQRLTELTAAFSQTAFGGAILAFLQERGTYIGFSRAIDAHAVAGMDNAILLQPAISNVLLFGALAHEARHIWQMEVLKDQLSLILPPEAVFARDVFMEADAYAFEQKFLQDYTVRTGDIVPLAAFLQEHDACDAPVKGSDAARFFFWADKVRNSDLYAATGVRRAQTMMREMESCDGASAFISRDYTRALQLETARTLDGCWPFSPGKGRPAHYLRNERDDAIAQAGRPSPAAQWALYPLNARYDALAAGRIYGATDKGRKTAPR